MPKNAAILKIPVDKSSPLRALMAATATRKRSPPTAPAASSLRAGQQRRITSSTTWAASADVAAIPEATASSKRSLVGSRARVLTRRKTLSTKASHSTSGSNHSAPPPPQLGDPLRRPPPAYSLHLRETDGKLGTRTSASGRPVTEGAVLTPALVKMRLTWMHLHSIGDPPANLVVNPNFPHGPRGHPSLGSQQSATVRTPFAAGSGGTPLRQGFLQNTH
eukprot:CAMPEP_0204371196 /NCGR_PEP_ID=MMETSP0469-20131031/46298_1 /ASSEMBLY_ACC=CAM_ASM_000384 /TAXON_ID=2969 /ORGANISM="Oxyrrhis marina" /LENGTH=219 /DNA_ID=CAMNT_0051361251 /DNA_START=343 /DNA_END=1001 /DNA_ORIENTATION=+